MIDSVFTLAQEIERCVLNAWPGQEVHALDGWRLRAAGGVTGRANSVWPNEHNNTLSVADKMAAVEQFYSERGLAPRYQITPAAQPVELDELLAQRGYQFVSPTYVQVASLKDIFQSTPPLRLFSTFKVEVAEQFDEDWFSLYALAENLDEYAATMRRVILGKIEPARGFVQVTIDDQPAAVGLGVVENGWLGIYCMSSLPAFRRRGAATAILRTLTIWAQMNDAQNAYLQVTQPNTAAQTLYQGVGFTTLYPYHYRIRPAAPQLE